MAHSQSPQQAGQRAADAALASDDVVQKLADGEHVFEDDEGEDSDEYGDIEVRRPLLLVARLNRC